MKELPRRFIERYEMIVPDVREFLESLMQWPRKAFRINAIKAPDDITARLSGIIEERVPWYGRGFFTSCQSLGNTIEHFMGYIYIQEASSMLPPAILDPRPGERVLDMAASPGSKTTQMADMMQNSGTIVANDVSIRRNKALVDNLERLGVTNTVVTNFDARNIGKKIGTGFDRVLLDAPCSGEGMLRKIGMRRFEWSISRINSLSRMQKAMIVQGFDLLRPGGMMVYSTCTGAPEENEGVVAHLLEARENAEIVKADVKGARQGIVEFGRLRFPEEVKKCIRIYPQDTGTELFFACLIRKRS